MGCIAVVKACFFRTCNAVMVMNAAFEWGGCCVMLCLAAGVCV